jgi:hypothetical protein
VLIGSSDGPRWRKRPELSVSWPLQRHFTRQEASWEWTELTRRVDSCRTAINVYETTYLEPSSGFRRHAITTVTYAYLHGTWRAILDQSTSL